MARAVFVGTPSRANRSAPRGVILVMLGGFFFSLAPLFARSIVGLDPAAITFFRSLVPVIFFGALTLVSPARRRDADWRRWSRRDIVAIAALGVLMAITSWSYTYSYLHTTVARAVLLNYTAPIYLAVLGPWLLHEARPRYFAIVIPLGIAGTVMITDPVGLLRIQSGEILGVLAGMLSGATYSFVFLLGRFLADRVASTTRVFYSTIFMALVLLPWGLAAPGAQLLPNLLWLVGLGFFAFAVPFFLVFTGQNHVTAQVSSLVALFEPVCGITLGFLVYHENLTLLGIAGAVAIMVSIVLTSRG